ncbi:methionyl-tRNA formyltransferase [Campylobacter sp. faydin G-140]|uniref:methionyl-tRNA formyltransferase n=1 Tax=Campylobacter anatolicus TaxID=2829105 RepID=UPI001B9F37C7|nr:methionyl-tRNA formyltransferase [Campylobacter anatolicus]MBR8465036.1 methionyl-tRNA formyltransferase [Campylobacter anatolicus]
MNVVFMGTPQYAVDILDALVNSNVNVVGVFTQPDKPIGRKQALTPSEVKIYAQTHLKNVKIYEPKTLRDESVVSELVALKPDFIVVAAYGKILPKVVLDISPCINLHASILPKYRGASPIQSALLNGEKQSGVTAMLMDEGLDTGDMLDFAYIDCQNLMADELFNALGKIGGELIVKTLKNFKNLIPIKQEESLATHCKKIQKSDGLINFEENAEQIYNKFRAYMPWPGIFTQSGLKILKLELVDTNGNVKSGEIFEIYKDSFVVGCKSGAIKIFYVQEPSKKAVAAVDYINGKRLRIGDFIY